MEIGAQRVPCEVALPPRKPMARVRRASFFEREVRVRLSSAAIEILFDTAAVLSEGQFEGATYYGSTMVTFDISRAGHRVSDACDLRSMRRITALVSEDRRIHKRLQELGHLEASRLSGVRLRAVQIDLRARVNGHHLHFDMDIEAKCGKRP